MNRARNLMRHLRPLETAHLRAVHGGNTASTSTSEALAGGAHSTSYQKLVSYVYATGNG